MNQKLQVAPVFIKKISTSDNSNDNIDSSDYKYVDIKNIITSYEIWQIFLDTNESSRDSCYIVIKGRYQTNGYARGDKEFTADMIGNAYDCVDVFNIIVSEAKPWDNYSYLASKYANGVDDCMIKIA